VTTTLVLHEDPVSGNCYKIRLTAALLGLPLARRFYDIRKGETRTPEFISAVNPNGRIPVLQIGEGTAARYLPESNAACWYLAQGTSLVPADRFAQADVLHWMFFEQYNHEPNVATLRFWLSLIGEADLTPQQIAAIPAKRANGNAALALMDEHLATRDWFVGDGLTLADIALYAYTHVAGEGGFVLAETPHVVAWCARVAGIAGYVPL